MKKDFSDWIKVQLKRGMFDENIDYIVIPLKRGVGNAGGYKIVNEYILTLDMAKHIALMSGTAKGKETRNYFIEVEKRFRSGETSEKAKDIDLEYIRRRTEQIESSGKQFVSFKKTFYEIGITRKEELIVTANRAVAKETGIDFIELAELKGISTPDRYFTVTELCQKVMDSDQFSEEAKKLVSTKAGDKPRPQDLNRFLEENGFQTKVDGVWKPTDKAKDFSDFVQNKSKHSEKTVFHTVWKMEILEEIF